MSELREKVARALYEEPPRPTRTWEELGEETRAIFVREAAEILAVVRERLNEPSEAMIRAGWEKYRDMTRFGPDDVWQAMLAAAFEEPKR